MSCLERMWAGRFVLGASSITNEQIIGELRGIAAELEKVASELQPTKENWLD
jgi:hypothetical protein